MKLYRLILIVLPAPVLAACSANGTESSTAPSGEAGSSGATGSKVGGSGGATGSGAAGTGAATGSGVAGTGGATGLSAAGTGGATGLNTAGSVGAGGTGAAGSNSATGTGGSGGSGGGTDAGSGRWTGNFDNFNTAAWGAAWGVAVPGDSYSFGQKDPGMAAVDDPSSPDGHQVLKVSYAAGSSARSCTGCPLPDGGQFYQDLIAIGRADLANASVLHMRYYLKFGDSTSAFDFGKAGKLPGLWGGIEGQESGCVGTGGVAWSTRLMWRGGKAEVYLYDPAHSAGSCGADLFWTSGTWQGDAQWHYVEQAVDRMAATVDVWYDGKVALSKSPIGAGYSSIPFRGVFFSTFYGGHATTWGPSVATTSYFAKYAIDTQYIGQ